MQKYVLLNALLLLLAYLPAAAQTRPITGTVTSADSPGGFPGATVRAAGTAVATATDAQGRYALDVPATATALVFTAVGMQPVTATIGNRTAVDARLLTDVQQLNEVVVTALGTTAQRDRFASSVTTLDGRDVVRSGETGLLTGLSGKVAGVLITRNGGDPGAGAYIQIRGQNTINGNIQPLFIIDGVPVSNASDNLGTGTATGIGIVQQSRINDLNPDDIERMDVLKGAAAAAIWGTRAANGVVVITTKKGHNSQGKVNIVFKSTLSLDRVNKLHGVQRTYGQGSGGLFAQGSRSSFGDRIADRPGGPDAFITAPGAGYAGFITFDDGSRRYALAPGTAANPNGGKNSQETFDHTQDAFQTGYFTDNSLSLSGGNDRSTFLVSYGNLYQEGVIKAFSNYQRQTARLNVASQFTDWLRASANVGFAKIASSRVQEGDNADGVLLGSLRTPADFDNARYTGTYTNAAGQVTPNVHAAYRNPLGSGSTSISNPVWNINNNRNTSDVNRLTGSLQLDLTPTNWLTVTGRTGLDNLTDYRLERFARLSANFPNGYLSKNWISEQQFNADAFATAARTFGPNVSGSLLVGVNYNSRRRATLGAAVSNLLIPTAPDILTNALNTNLAATNANSLLRTYAYYAQADVAAYDMVFLTLTGRQESASTFGPQTSNKFFFPSAALAWQFSKVSGLAASNLLSFGKLRLTWGQVGIQPQPYQNFASFGPAAYGDMFTRGLSAASALYGGGYVRGAAAANESLRPERKTETEIGVDLRFLRNRFSLSATAYHNRSQDVVLPLDVPAETGYAIRNTNAAELTNKGLELEAGAELLRRGSFRWNASANFSLNRNNVVSLAGVTAFKLPDSFMQNASLLPGQPFGVFYSTDFKKDDAGRYVLDANGFPQGGTGNEIIGNPNPKWRGGLGSTFAYGGLSLAVLFDRVAGNDFFNGTRGSLYNLGTHADQGTAVAPAGGLKDFRGALIPAGTAFQGQIRDFGGGPVALTQPWYQGPGTVNNSASIKQFVEDGSATRLREATLTYRLDGAGFRAFSHLSNVDFSLTGRNLVLWTPYSGTDPEVNVTGAGLARGQDWFTNPNTRSVLFSVRVVY